MPLICLLDGISIYMYFRLGEHEPPHIHALYQGNSVVVNILDFKVIGKTKLSKSIVNKVTKWTEAHQKELLDIWVTQIFKEISPDF